MSISIDKLNNYMKYQDQYCDVSGSEACINLKYKGDVIAWYVPLTDRLTVNKIESVYTKKIISKNLIKLFHEKIQHLIYAKKYFIKVLDQRNGFLSRKNTDKSEYRLMSKRNSRNYQNKFTYDEIVEMRKNKGLNINWNNAVIEEEE